jgi:cell division protein FtsL
MMKKISKNLFVFAAGQLCIALFIVQRATNRIELSYTAEALRQKIRTAEASCIAREQEYYALTASNAILTSAHERGFIPAPISAHRLLPSEHDIL